MLLSRVVSLFCLFSLVFFVVGFCLASAKPGSKLSDTWGSIIWFARWVYLALFVLGLLAWFAYSAFSFLSVAFSKPINPEIIASKLESAEAFKKLALLAVLLLLILAFAGNKIALRFCDPKKSNYENMLTVEITLMTILVMGIPVWIYGIISAVSFLLG